MFFKKEKHDKGPEHLSYADFGTVFEIYPLTPSHNPTTSTRLGFSVDDVESYIENFEKIGAEIIEKPFTSEWGIKAIVKDPDGHVVELLTEPNREK